MATDLREKQGTTVRPEAVGPGRPGPGTRWLFVVTGIVLVVLAAVAVLVFAQGRQPVFGPDHWATNVEGTMTDVREGSGNEPAAAINTRPPSGSARYADGALAEIREGSGYAPVGVSGPWPDLLTEDREGGSYAVRGGMYPDLMTEAREG